MDLTEKEFTHGIILTVNEVRIDMAISRIFREKISMILEKKPKVLIINLTGVDYLDSSALGALVTILKEAKSYGGSVRLTDLNQTLRTLIKLSKLESMFPIYENIDEAMHS